MAGVIATMLMQIQVKSQQQLYAEKLTKNGLCLSVDLETQPLVSVFLIHDHKTLQVPKILQVKWQNLKIASLVILLTTQCKVRLKVQRKVKNICNYSNMQHLTVEKMSCCTTPVG